ncbi:hypothetical protein [Niastella vici]|nr:hypothetical protein [Niastella vici]
MNYDTRLQDLILKQERQVHSFERHRASMWDAVQATEKEILEQHDCTYSDAPPHILTIINKLREDYYRYWWNDGILFTALMRRQAAARQRILDTIK